MKYKMLIILIVLIYGCVLFSCNETQVDRNVVVILDGNKFVIKRNGMLSRNYFCFSKRKDNFYDIYMCDMDFVLYFYKTKNKYTVNNFSCPNSEEVLCELRDILNAAKEIYPIDSIRQICTGTDNLLDIANELAVNIPPKNEHIKVEEVEKVIKQTSLKSYINEVVNDYGLEVTCITLGIEPKPIRSNTKIYNQGAFYSAKNGEQPKELLLIPLSIILDKKKQH